ncbi:MAG TPA: hypothetical protein VFF06_31230 [Polyangia bacterium]|nr:hypothetical protein [Polyangia bacterium]
MPSEGPSRPWIILKRLAPYLIAVVALVWVFRHVDLHEMLLAFRHAPIALFVAVSAVALVVNCMADTFAMGTVFRWFGCRVPYWDLFFVRASTYLVAVVNYHVGQAALIGYLYKARKVPLLRATGWILFIIGINVGTLFLLASWGASQASSELEILRLVPVACGVGVVVYSALLVLKPRILANRALLAPLFEMGIPGHVKGVGVRLPHIGVLLLWHYFSLRAFGIDVTWKAALLYLPAYFAVSSLPINVNGLGVAQLVAIEFFSRFAVVPPGTVDVAGAQKATVIAYSLGTSGVSILLQLVLGLLCLRRGTVLGLGAPASEPAGEAASS